MPLLKIAPGGERRRLRRLQLSRGGAADRHHGAAGGSGGGAGAPRYAALPRLRLQTTLPTTTTGPAPPRSAIRRPATSIASSPTAACPTPTSPICARSFPDRGSDNFLWVPELDGWVWSTFYAYQWDLNFGNPALFDRMLAEMLFLANRRGRGAAARRGAVHLEGAGHRLREPARRAPADPRVQTRWRRWRRRR